jgi:FkbM family methyltransferase
VSVMRELRRSPRGLAAKLLGRAGPSLPTRDGYVASPLPIRDELLRLFDPSAEVVIFDIGACEGEDAIRYARLFPAAIVVAVEPLAANVERARSLRQRYGTRNVRIIEVALSDSEGIAPFYVSAGRPPGTPDGLDWDFGNKSSSLLRPTGHRDQHPWVTFEKTIEVRTTTLRRLCKELGLERVDFIHLDVQGAELKVLRGAGPLLGRVTAIWLEVEAIPLYAGQPLKGDIADYLTTQGFRLVKDSVGSVSGDQLWVSTAGLGRQR